MQRTTGAPQTDRRRTSVDQRSGSKSVNRSSPLSEIVRSLLGDDLPVAIEFYDGGRLGPADPPATIEVRSPDALQRIVTSPGRARFRAGIRGRRHRSARRHLRRPGAPPSPAAAAAHPVAVADGVAPRGSRCVSSSAAPTRGGPPEGPYPFPRVATPRSSRTTTTCRTASTRTSSVRR